MTFWISGIVEAEVGEAFRHTMNKVQDSLDLLANTNDYGNAIKEVNVIFIINRDSINEYRRVMKKAQSLEARIRIDYDEFQASGDAHRTEMFVDGLITIVENTTGFNEETFCKDRLIRNLRSIVAHNEAT